MATTTLGSPPAVLSTSTRLATTIVEPSHLYRISRYATGEPYFGKSGNSRFDAPDCRTGSASYGTCYLGLSLQVAIAESLLHDEEPVDGDFEISLTDLNRHYLHRFNGSPLFLLNLTGATLKRMAGHAELAGTVDYALTQRWSEAVFMNPQCFDGFVYMSRHLNTDSAVALFDRASSKVAASQPPLLLSSAPGYTDAAHHLGIMVI